MNEAESITGDIHLGLKQFCFGEKSVDLFVPDADQLRDKYNKGLIAFPFWGKVWPAAVALSKFLLQQPYYVQNKNVLELGAGLGLPSIVAAAYASSVVCSDKEGEAVAAIKKSADHNQLANFSTLQLDWSTLPADEKTDVLLLSDINYEPAFFELQQQMLMSFLDKGTTIIVSTPQRLMAKSFFTPLLPSCIYQQEIAVASEEGIVNISVLVFKNVTLPEVRA